jgi:enoyl-[acyl-carrier protein] reductase II
VYARRLKDADIFVYHAVSSVDGALRAEDAGIDGVIVEGAESAAFRSPAQVHTFTLMQAVRRRVELPIVAAGGIVDGVGMAAAFALRAEAVQMGTRFWRAWRVPFIRPTTMRSLRQIATVRR